MLGMIKNYVENLTKDDLYNFALSKNISLSDSELDFLYKFIKKNYEALYINPNIDISKYKSFFTEENYIKILNLISDYKIKYAKYLN